MRALLLTLALIPSLAAVAQDGVAIAAPIGEHASKRPEGLRDALMGKFHAMDAANRGIFQDDISPLVASYFPVGEPFGEVEKMIRDQGLGSLHLFKGKHDPAEGTMYVTQFSLMTGAFSTVYIVLDLDFAGRTEGDMVLKKAGGFIRGSNM